MAKLKSNKMLWLLFGIPAASIAMGVVTFVLAFNSLESPVTIDERPLSKTSWDDDS